MACEFSVSVKAKLMLTAIHCLLYFTYFLMAPYVIYFDIAMFVD